MRGEGDVAGEGWFVVNQSFIKGYNYAMNKLNVHPFLYLCYIHETSPWLVDAEGHLISAAYLLGAPAKHPVPVPLPQVTYITLTDQGG